MNDDSPVANEILLLQSAVECEVLKPKGNWKRVIGTLDDYITALENQITELEKLQGMRVLENFTTEKQGGIENGGPKVDKECTGTN